MDVSEHFLTWKVASREDMESGIHIPVVNVQEFSSLHSNAIQIISLPQSEGQTMQEAVQNIQIELEDVQTDDAEAQNVDSFLLYNKPEKQTQEEKEEVPHKKRLVWRQRPTKKKITYTANKGRIQKKSMLKVPLNGMAYYSEKFGLKMPPKKALGIKGMILHRQARELIMNVFKFMKEEAQSGIKIPISSYRERVLAATGISKCTYSRITSKEYVHGQPPPVRKRKGDTNIENVPAKTVQEEDSLCRPKINRDASTRDGVYDLDDVIPNGVLDTLIPQASAVLNSGDSIEEYQLTPFCTDSINKILSLNTPEEIKVRNIAIFFYINYLIKFMNTPFKNITKRYVACDISQEVNRHILDNFCVYTQNGRTRPIHMKDKCLCYIIVLAAIAKEYEVNVALLSKDLKIGLKKAVEVSRILAFNTSSKDKTIVTLNLPLPAPVTFTSKRKVK
nr:unnamed protein product [Callosobruchus chinensis]